MTTPDGTSEQLPIVLTSLTLGESEDDIRIFDDDRLVYACYDNGRTQVLDPESHQSRGIVEILKDALPGGLDCG